MLTTFHHVSHTTTEDYFHDSIFAIQNWNRKYAVRDGESPVQGYWRMAQEAAKAEDDPQKAAVFARLWFDMFYRGIARPGGSVQQGLGHPIDHISTINCTADPNPQDTLESISETQYRMLKVAAYRQGQGLALSSIRPADSPVKNAAQVSTGVLNWMAYLDRSGNYVGQHGRVPAYLFSLAVDHPDILRFIKAKSDIRAISNANISVLTKDAFMEAVRSDTDWDLTFDIHHHDGEVTPVRKTIRAREILEAIAKQAWEWSEPGVQYIDSASYWSNSDYLGSDLWKIRATNACSEQLLEAFLLRDHERETLELNPGDEALGGSMGSCMLASLNAGVAPTDPEGLRLWMGHYMGLLVRFQDNVISRELTEERYATDEQRVSLEHLRRIGLGFTNLHAWLLHKGLHYGSEAGAKAAGTFAQEMTYAGYKASIALGHEKGSFKAFDRDQYIQSPFIQRMMQAFPDLEFHAMRNVCVTSVAPTGTLSTQFPETVLSYGIEPANNLYYWKRSRTRGDGNWDYYFVVPDVIQELLKEKTGIDLKDHGLTSSTIQDTFDGQIGQPIKEIIETHRDTIPVDVAHTVTPRQKMRLMAEVQQWIDSSISTSYNIPENSQWTEVYDLMIEAWESGLKALSVYRDASRYGIIEFVPFKERAEQIHAKGLAFREGDFSQEDLELLSFDPFSSSDYSGVKLGSDEKHYTEYRFSAESKDKFYVLLRNDHKAIFITNYKPESRSREHILMAANRLQDLLATVDPRDAEKQADRSQDSLAKFTRMLSKCLRNGLEDDAIAVLEEFAVPGTLASYLAHQVFRPGTVTSGQPCPVCHQPLLDDGAGCVTCTCGYERCS